jgi:hypothetical protein
MSTDIAPVPASPAQDTHFPTVDLTSGRLPDLSTAQVFPVDLVSEYFSPTTEGESIRCIFFKIDTATAADQQTGDPIDLECVFFAVPDEKGNARIFRNGSRQLVGTIVDGLRQGRIATGSPLEITWKGKRKAKQGNKFYDSWSVVALILA